MTRYGTVAGLVIGDQVCSSGQQRTARGGSECQKTSEQRDVADALRKRTPDNPLCALLVDRCAQRGGWCGDELPARVLNCLTYLR